MEESIRYLWEYISDNIYDVEIFRIIEASITIVRRYYTFGFKDSPIYFHEYRKELVCGAAFKIATSLLAENEDNVYNFYPECISNVIYRDTKFTIEVYIINNFSHNLLNNKKSVLKDFENYINEVENETPVEYDINRGKIKSKIVTQQVRKLQQLYKHNLDSDMPQNMTKKFVEILCFEKDKMCSNIIYTKEMVINKCF